MDRITSNMADLTSSFSAILLENHSLRYYKNMNEIKANS